jgi:hypothetical protein
VVAGGTVASACWLLTGPPVRSPRTALFATSPSGGSGDVDEPRDDTRLGSPLSTRGETDAALHLIGGTFALDRAATRRLVTPSRPRARQRASREKLDTVAAICRLLQDRLHGSHIPQVATRPAHHFGGRSLLEAIAADHHALVFDVLGDTLDPW